MSEPKKTRKKQQYSALTRALLRKYVLTVIGYIIAFAMFVFAAYKICASFVWYPENALYWILKFVKEYILLFAMIFLLIGWIVITYYYIAKPLRYLDEVVAATEKLIDPSRGPVALSEELYYTESELNRVRDQALENMRMVKEAEQRKNDLIVYLAHDLKTPLSSVIGYLTLLRDEGQISEELREKYLSISLDKAEHLEDLINEFFEITRFNLSNITLETSRVNLTRMLEQLVFEFKPMLMEKSLGCELVIAPDIMAIIDANKMQRVFDNLLRNAVNYSFDNTVISITATQIEKNISIKFINSGNTIPKAKLGRIFEQFFRLDTSRSSRSGGAGLGLAIAKEIVELHGGTITANSENEKIVFEVIIPLL